MDSTQFRQQPPPPTVPTSPRREDGYTRSAPDAFDADRAQNEALPRAGAAQGSDPWIGDATTGLGLGPYIRLVRHYKFLIVTVIALCMSAAVLKVVLAPKVFMATTTILPSGNQTSGGMLGLLASMTGAPPMIGGGTESSSALFPKILESRLLSLEVLNSKYKYQKDGVATEGTLMEYLGAKTQDEALLGLKGIRAVDVDKEMGIITVSASTPEAQLSTQIANRCIEVLEKFNREARRLDATENSSFIQDRLDKVRAELADAEEKLAQFREQNMRAASPELDLERLRFERDVALKSQVFVTLSNQAEIARVEEAKNMPIVRVLDRALVPELPVRVPKIALLAAGGLGGVVVAGMLIAMLEFLKSLRREAATA